MKIAIIGAGFSGLALAWHLLDKGASEVIVFDQEGIGKGASGIASGLVHPYAGEQVRRSWRASQALNATKQLLATAQNHTEEKVADYSGIIRITQDEEQVEALLEHEKEFQDVERIGSDQFLIKSGITVFTQIYLEGLWKACESKGAKFCYRKISSILELQGYEAIIVAAGAGISQFEEFEHWQLSYIKGQSLTCYWPKELEPLVYSIAGKGHIAKGSAPGLFSIGATYERNYSEEGPNIQVAMEDLQEKAKLLFPSLKHLEVKEARSGIRVMSRGHYLPQIGKVFSNLWVMTGLGSRGLLYHSFFAEMLARALLFHEELAIPPEVHLLLSKNRDLSYNRG